ncbi:ras-related protein Rab-32 isoform X2 [Aethina tumida]|uniref:ras-related protein Rab-32 isoform X2 n=1 Tax=Aethina tumida TaxID=116153 RepID=UPI00214788A7|nr:ras-related protein Rab-32 isoform X2 [Aethina tumida]
MQRKFYIIVYLEMIEEATERRLSRRTRSERTKRRERYLLRNCANKCENDIYTYNISASSADSVQLPTINDFYNRRNIEMGNKKMSIVKQSVNKPRDHLYKILVIGDLGTGKTSIIKRYVHKFFTQNYRATIGVDFALKVITWDENTLVRLQLWDIAGQERYGNMTRVYYKEAVGAFIVFDVTRKNTLDSVANWKSDLDAKVQLPDGSPIPCVLLANKCDQPKEGIVNVPSKMDEYCKEKGFTAWFETSAKDDININEAADALVQTILNNDALLNNDKKDEDQITLNKYSNNDDEGRKKCAC